MSRYFTIWIPMAAGLIAASSALAAEQHLRMPPPEPPAPTVNRLPASNLAAYFDDEADAESPDHDYQEPACGGADELGCGCEASCGCEPSCGCEAGCCEPSCGCDSGCGSSCGNGGWGSCLGDCSLGDAWTLKDELHPCCDTWNYGGWIQAGYHDDNTRLSYEYGDLRAFNDVPDNLNLHQAYVYFEKLVDADDCSADWGGRVDLLYGTDAQKTQAFGNPGGRWDASWDHGVYGWAIPQAYVELAYGDWSWKLGKFYTVVGYEVVTAPDNFFYSHAYTMFNSEPFTHTGVLGTYAASEDVTIYTGWTLGWDTGFDQFGGGSNFLGGFGLQLTDDVKYTYICTAGDLGWRGEGYSHSNVVDVTLSENWQYVFQSDYVNTNFETPSGNDNEDVGVNQYLFYTLNDCWKVGSRAEWWKSNNVTGDAQSFYQVAAGLNYHASSNLVVRPEIRYNWTPAEEAYQAAINENFNQWVFGVDAIVTF
jgi:Putative beta-barrel porin-2, OmpL-like. bbp2